MIAVRLCDVPLEVRITAAHVAKAHARSEDERRELLLAAVCPSDQTYWVREDARPIVEAWKRAA